MIDVAVIIVSWNVRQLLEQCLRSVYAELEGPGLNGRVWVVDNASIDGTIDLLADLFPRVTLIANEHNPGFGAANNQGMRAAAVTNPRFFFLLNPDTLLQPGSLKALAAALDERPSAGVAGAKLVYGDGRFQSGAFYFPSVMQIAFDLFPLPARLYESRLNGRYPFAWYDAGAGPFPVDFVLGATMLVRAELVEKTGGFNEAFHMYCEEIDWCWRIRQAGWKIVVVPAAEVVHFGGESTRQIPAQSLVNLWGSRAQLYRKHYGRLTNALATRLVQIGMKRKAAQTDDPALKQAYRDIIALWRNEQ